MTSNTKALHTATFGYMLTVVSLCLAVVSTNSTVKVAAIVATIIFVPITAWHIKLLWLYGLDNRKADK